MPYHERRTGYYPEENPYNVDDKIRWKRNGEVMRVGDDFDELYYWYPNDGDKTHIVTTCGRVLSITEIERA